MEKGKSGGRERLKKGGNWEEKGAWVITSPPPLPVAAFHQARVAQTSIFCFSPLIPLLS